MQPNIELRQKSAIPKTIIRSGKKFKVRISVPAMLPITVAGFGDARRSKGGLYNSD
jgi:hypothetical protein